MPTLSAGFGRKTSHMQTNVLAGFRFQITVRIPDASLGIIEY
jgi:hypothetical protein